MFPATSTIEEICRQFNKADLSGIGPDNTGPSCDRYSPSFLRMEPNGEAGATFRYSRCMRMADGEPFVIEYWSYVPYMGYSCLEGEQTYGWTARSCMRDIALLGPCNGLSPLEEWVPAP